ncbi:hypothetical protein EG328_006606 [Venturia inaequalis]|uniref:Uncharacterized protein n=1 Tax=Venturia inaequalis TaxID=5025 RepID=A0A8H3YQN0_VENIN|nr:hypothetical protein EG328_006606 [Venturia inaequalis]
MSSETRRSSISSDWEEIDAISGADGFYDDMASILSLSATVNDSEGSDDLASPTSAVLPNEEGTNPPKYDDDDTNSLASDGTITEDLLDILIEPPMLLSNLESLQSTVSEILLSCEDQHSPGTHEAVSGVLKALHRLLGTITDLKEVVSGFVKIWKPNDPFSTAPRLDPLLYKWCTTCALKLYKLQADDQLAADTKEYSSCFNKFCDDLTVFLLILRVYEPYDLDDHQTSRLNFPSNKSEVLPSHHTYLHRRYRNTEPQPVVDGPIPALRRRLYALKDEIGKANNIISDSLVTKVFSADKEQQLREIQALQTPIFGALGTMLSNHGSNWIEQTIAGGMSYVEFTSLDGKDIQAIEHRISKFGNLLDVQRSSCSYSSGNAKTAEPGRWFTLDERRYDWTKGAKRIPNNGKADFSSAALEFESVKAMLLGLSSVLKIEAEKH